MKQQQHTGQRNARQLCRDLAVWICAALMAAACSTTSKLNEGEYLYTGIKTTKVHDAQGTYEESVALTEVEAALAYAPNGAFMGSSSLRTPFPIGLWLWNSMVDKEHTAVGRWLMDTFATPPVTMSMVNPTVRTKVASNLLQNYGYFRGYVDYEILPQRNPRKQKIRYDIHLGQPYSYDSISYIFEGTQDSIVRANFGNRLLKTGGQFSVPDLQAEKTRLTSDFRNNGYYYYRPDYIRYFADSLQVPQRVQLRVVPDLDMPERANRQYYIGNIHTYVRKSQQATRSTQRNTTTQRDSTQYTRRDSTQSTRRYAIQYDDSIDRGPLRYAWQGNKIPIRPNVLFRNFRFKRNELFDQSKIDQTITGLSGMQTFSQMQFVFTPRDTTATCDTIDVTLNAVMDKLIDLEFDFSITQKSNAQVGPKAGLRLSKRNAFGHGETFSIGLKGSYEWQTGNRRLVTDGTRPDSWEAGLDASLTYPWIAFPWLSNMNTKYPSSTTFKVSADNLKRAGYYRLVSFGLDATYNWRSSRLISHQFTPLSLAYNQLLSTTARFDSITARNTALYASLRDQFIPAMQYVYTFDDNVLQRPRFTTRFVGTIKEAGNIVSAIHSAFGKPFSQEEKQLLGTPYSQFIKVSGELTNTFRLTDKSQLVTHLLAGAIFTYGNTRYAPYSELFYVGGANSIRAFGVRTLGPGRYYDTTGRGTYLDQAGDFKLEANVEYRFNMVSNLNGALFIDAGNVWNLKADDSHPGGKLGDGGFFNNIALGTGFGLRYDLEFLVLRLDLGIGIHAPYDTGRSGYYNMPKFWDSLGLHFAVGYPF